MHRLETFGHLVLRGVETPTRAHRRRAALLVLIAGAGERGLSRDKIQAWLWPEVPFESSRHALEQLLYALRRDLGPAAFLGTNPIALNPAVISSDLADFNHAIETGQLETALALYRGPFLDGFFLSGSAEFERWTDEVRATLAGAALRAASTLSERSESQRDLPAALEWARRAAALAPTTRRGPAGSSRCSTRWEIGRAPSGSSKPCENGCNGNSKWPPRRKPCA
jgi:serine/threonine-protein kinase